MTCKSVKTEKPLFQWDVNQYLIVQDADYVDYQINGDIYRVRVEEGKCLIPDELLQTGGMKTVWACADTGTRVAHTFGVESRPIPPDYVFTPTQRETFDQLVERVDESIEQARADVETLKGEVETVTREAEDATAEAERTSEDIKQKANEGYFDGYSPSAKVERTTNGVKVSVTDKDGTTEAEVHDGTDAQPYDDTEIKKEISKKVGYSEVKDGKLLMYVDETKAVLLAEMDLPVYDDSEIKAELSDKVGDVQVNGTSIAVDGVANIPVASSKNLGASRCDSGESYGISIVDGNIRTNPALNFQINSRNNAYAPITTATLDHAVKAALTDGKGPAYTEAEQLAARQRIGIDKPWTLKGTLTTENKDTGVNVDLSGCTEIFIKGNGIVTSNTTLQFIGPSGSKKNCAYYCLQTNKRAFIASWRYNGLCVENISHSFSTNIGSEFADAYTGTSILGWAIDEINGVCFYSSSPVTSCNIEIYAR